MNPVPVSEESIEFVLMHMSQILPVLRQQATCLPTHINSACILNLNKNAILVEDVEKIQPQWLHDFVVEYQKNTRQAMHDVLYLYRINEESETEPIEISALDISETPYHWSEAARESITQYSRVAVWLSIAPHAYETQEQYRRRFRFFCLENVIRQKYPHDKITLVILEINKTPTLQNYFTELQQTLNPIVTQYLFRPDISERALATPQKILGAFFDATKDSDYMVYMDDMSFYPSCSVEARIFALSLRNEHIVGTYGSYMYNGDRMFVFPNHDDFDPMSLAFHRTYFTTEEKRTYSEVPMHLCHVRQQINTLGRHVDERNIPKTLEFIGENRDRCDDIIFTPIRNKTNA